MAHTGNTKYPESHWDVLQLFCTASCAHRSTLSPLRTHFCLNERRPCEASAFLWDAFPTAHPPPPTVPIRCRSPSLSFASTPADPVQPALLRVAAASAAWPATQMSAPALGVSGRRDSRVLTRSGRVLTRSGCAGCQGNARCGARPRRTGHFNGASFTRSGHYLHSSTSTRFSIWK